MGFAASFYTATEIASEDAPSTEIGVVRFRLIQPTSRLPTFQSSRFEGLETGGHRISIALAIHSFDSTLQLFIPRKVMEFLQPLIVRDHNECIVLLHLQIGSRIVLKPTLRASYRNRDQSRSTLNICFAKR